MIRKTITLLLLFGILFESIPLPRLSAEVKVSKNSMVNAEIQPIVVNTLKKENAIVPIETKGEITEELLAKAEKQRNLLPKSLQEIFVKMGWHIYLTTENLAETELPNSYSSIWGITRYADKYIKVAANEGAIEGALIHEFGHFLDDYLGKVTKTKSFSIMYEEEKESVFELGLSYDADSKKEYFAKCFQYYILNKETAEKLLPVTSGYFQELLNTCEQNVENLFYIESIPLSADIQQYIYDTCEEYGEDPYVILELIRKESSFFADAENGDCKGLTQMSLKWHTDRMEKLQCDDIFNPKQNILLCIDFVHELHKQKDDLIYVLMRYNMKIETADRLYEEGNYSDYATGILERAEKLRKSQKS